MPRQVVVNCAGACSEIAPPGQGSACQILETAPSRFPISPGCTFSISRETNSNRFSPDTSHQRSGSSLCGCSPRCLDSLARCFPEANRGREARLQYQPWRRENFERRVAEAQQRPLAVQEHLHQADRSACFNIARAACVRGLPKSPPNWVTRSVCGQSRHTRITPLSSFVILCITPSIPAARFARCDRNHFAVTVVCDRGMRTEQVLLVFG
jgi:hypothetical protein